MKMFYINDNNMVSFLLFRGIEIQTHDFKCESLFIELVGLLKLRLVDQLTERALLPLIVIPFLPVLLRLLQGFLQVLLVLSVVQLVAEITSIGVGQVSVGDFDADWTNNYF